MSEGTNQISCPDVGGILRKTREHKGMSVQQVADSLHLRPSIIEAIDANSFKEIPGVTFLRGYVKSYARLLKLSEDDISTLLQQALDFEQNQIDAANAQNKGGKGRPGLLILALVVVVVGVFVFLFKTGQLDRFHGDNFKDNAGVTGQPDQVDVVESGSGNSALSSESDVFPRREEKEDLTHVTATFEPSEEMDNSRRTDHSSIEPVPTSIEPVPTETPLAATLPIENAEPEVEEVIVPMADDAFTAAGAAELPLNVIDVPVTSMPEAEPEIDIQENVVDELVVGEVGSQSEVGSQREVESSLQSEPSLIEVAQPVASDVIAPLDEVLEEQPALEVDSIVTSNTEENVAQAFGEISATFTGDCWFQVKNGDGRTVIASLKKSGEVSSYKGKLPFSLVIGAVSEVSMTFQGKPVDFKQFRVRNNRTDFELK